MLGLPDLETTRSVQVAFYRRSHIILQGTRTSQRVYTSRVLQPLKTAVDSYESQVEDSGSPTILRLFLHRVSLLLLVSLVKHFNLCLQLPELDDGKCDYGVPCNPEILELFARC